MSSSSEIVDTLADELGLFEPPLHVRALVPRRALRGDHCAAIWVARVPDDGRVTMFFAMSLDIRLRESGIEACGLRDYLEFSEHVRSPLFQKANNSTVAQHAKLGNHAPARGSPACCGPEVDVLVEELFDQRADGIGLRQLR